MRSAVLRAPLAPEPDARMGRVVLARLGLGNRKRQCGVRPPRPSPPDVHRGYRRRCCRRCPSHRPRLSPLPDVTQSACRSSGTVGGQAKRRRVAVEFLPAEELRRGHGETVAFTGGQAARVEEDSYDLTAGPPPLRHRCGILRPRYEEAAPNLDAAGGSSSIAATDSQTLRVRILGRRNDCASSR
jgi:hypothetical protein